MIPLDDSKFQTIETDKDAKGVSRQNLVHETPAFNTAFSSASRPQSTGVFAGPYNSRYERPRNHPPSVTDSVYQLCASDALNEESKQKTQRGTSKIPKKTSKRKESYRKQLEFDNNNNVEEHQKKLDSIKEKINRKISNIRSSVDNNFT